MDNEPRPITQGLLDALVLTPIADPAADPGSGPTFLGIEVRGLPGFRCGLEIWAARKLQQAMAVLLGPGEMPALAPLLRRYFEIGDRPCEPNGDRNHVGECWVLERQLRQLVGAPPSRRDPGGAP